MRFLKPKQGRTIVIRHDERMKISRTSEVPPGAARFIQGETAHRLSTWIGGEINQLRDRLGEEGLRGKRITVTLDVETI